MNEPKNRTPIGLKDGVKTTTEKEATISLRNTYEKLIGHRGALVRDMGEMRGNAHFQTHCGDLYGFVEDRMNEGLKNITVRIIGRSKHNKSFLQFAFTDESKVDHSFTVHKDCLQDIKELHSSQFRYEPIVSTQVAA